MHEQTILVMDAAEEPKALVLLTAFSSFPGQFVESFVQLFLYLNTKINSILQVCRQTPLKSS